MGSSNNFDSAISIGGAAGQGIATPGTNVLFNSDTIEPGDACSSADCRSKS